MQVKLNFQFKGNRPYVRGAEVYTAIIELLQDQGLAFPEELALSFHTLIANQLRGELVAGRIAPEQENLAVLAQFQTTQGPYTLSLYPRATAVTERAPYDSGPIGAASTLEVDAKRNTVEGLPDISLINKVIALNKALLQALFPEETGLWFFVKLQLEQALETFPTDSTVAVELVRHLGTRFTKSVVRINGAEVGIVNYSLHQKALT